MVHSGLSQHPHSHSNQSARALPSPACAQHRRTSSSESASQTRQASPRTSGHPVECALASQIYKKNAVRSFEHVVSGQAWRLATICLTLGLDGVIMTETISQRIHTAKRHRFSERACGAVISLRRRQLKGSIAGASACCLVRALTNCEGGFWFLREHTSPFVWSCDLTARATRTIDNPQLPAEGGVPSAAECTRLASPRAL